MNEMDPTFTMDAAKAMETNLIYTPSTEEKGTYDELKQNVFKTHGYWSRTTLGEFLQRSINGKSSDDCKRVRKLYNVLKIVNRVDAHSIYNSSMIRLAIFDHAYKTSGKAHVLKKIEHLAEVGYVPAMHRLIRYNTVPRLTVFCNLERLHQLGQATKDEQYRLGKYYFLGLSPVQSYEKAMELGVPPNLCAPRSEYAADYLIVPISQMYRYFTDWKFLLSLRLVCKSWNHTIQRTNLFWGQGKTYQTVISEMERMYIARMQQLLKHQKKCLKQSQAKLKRKKREIELLEGQIKQDERKIDQLEKKLRVYLQYALSVGIQKSLHIHQNSIARQPVSCQDISTNLNLVLFNDWIQIEMSQR
jgi:hypothetical protein